MEQINSCREFVCPFTCFRVSPRAPHLPQVCGLPTD
uniref:Uncharacterized protein n=1 Tax=Setaria viridis TaxID=4556 RepID=A0A4U6UAL9_SETVI|nr:hypothetical protein SEVIR_7G297815v2 [Setaria viridis]